MKWPCNWVIRSRRFMFIKVIKWYCFFPSIAYCNWSNYEFVNEIANRKRSIFFSLFCYKMMRDENIRIKILAFFTFSRLLFAFWYKIYGFLISHHCPLSMVNSFGFGGYKKTIHKLNWSNRYQMVAFELEPIYQPFLVISCINFYLKIRTVFFSHSFAIWIAYVGMYEMVIKKKHEMQMKQIFWLDASH